MRPIFAAIGAGVVLGVCAGIGTMVYVTSGPAVYIQSVDEADAMIAPGDDTISFVVSGGRTKSCDTTVSRYLWRWIDFKGRKVKEFRPIENPPLSPMPGRGEFEYMITLHVPTDFPRGLWFERTVTMEHCGWFNTEQPKLSPDRPITISDAGASSGYGVPAGG